MGGYSGQGDIRERGGQPGQEFLQLPVPGGSQDAMPASLHPALLCLAERAAQVCLGSWVVQSGCGSPPSEGPLWRCGPVLPECARGQMLPPQGSNRLWHLKVPARICWQAAWPSLLRGHCRSAEAPTGNPICLRLRVERPVP